MTVFKAYDIRGTFPEQVNEELAYKIGRAFVTFLGCKKVHVGRDARTSSPALFESLTKGIMDQGADVVDLGLCSSPLFYFGSKQSESAIMITASHNPKQYNGFKMCRENCIPISGDDGIKEIEKLVEENNFTDAETKGTMSSQDNMEEFLSYSINFVEPTLKPWKVILDTGNGMGGLTFPKAFAKLDFAFTPLHCEVDGTFPHHQADPLQEKNIEDIKQKVKDDQADLGIAVDGDADRVFFIDETGKRVNSDLITALIAQHFLRSEPRILCLYDLRSSKIVQEAIIAGGGEAKMSRVGHSFIKKQMREEDAYFAGEISGHFYYAENGYTENTIITTLLVLQIMSSWKKPLSEIIKPLQKYYSTGELNFTVEDKEGKMKAVEEAFKNEAKEILHLDGVSVICEEWWCNVRASNTEPLLRLNLEANTQEKMQEMKEKVSEIIEG
jgi:phosphomannomutase